MVSFVTDVVLIIKIVQTLKNLNELKIKAYPAVENELGPIVTTHKIGYGCFHSWKRRIVGSVMGLERQDLFEFDNLQDFLSTYYESRKKTHPSFSYKSWANKARLGQAATISRLVKGQRSAGAELADKLAEYFGFSQTEKEYFNLLVQRDKETDENLATMIAEKLEELRRENRGENPVKYLSFKGNQIVLWGMGDLKKTNSLLPEGMVANYYFNKSMIGLRFGHCHDCDFGICFEFSVIVHARPEDASLTGYNLFFPEEFLFTNSELHQSLWQKYWNINYRRDGRSQFYWDEKKSMNGEFTLNNEPVLKLKYDRINEFEKQPHDLKAYSLNDGKMQSYQIVGRSDCHMSDYNPVFDTFEVNPKSDLAKYLQAVDFQPTQWAVHHNYSAEVYLPG